MKKLIFHNHKFATAFVTIYLIVYTILHQTGASLMLLSCMFALSPFLIVWMAYSILRYGKFNSRELQEHEEWGYCDKKKDELGMF
jgi:hypothetical protein